MAYGSKKLVIPPGITKLSEIIIDADKDFKGHTGKNVRLFGPDGVLLYSPKGAPYFFTPLNTLERRVRKTGVDWDSAYSVAWSPDGKYVAIASYDADAVEIAEFTGTDLVRKVRKTGVDWDGAYRVAWSPDGKYVAIASYDADAVEVAEFTGTDLVRKVRKTGVDWDGAYSVAWSPDGKYVAIASGVADAVEIVS